MNAALAIAIPFFPDPLGPASAVSDPWTAVLQALAQRLYLSLFVIELIVMGARIAIFKDSILAFTRSFASKVLIAIAICYAISNAGAISRSAVDMVAALGQSVSSCDRTSVTACTSSSTSALSAACNAHMRYACVRPPSGDPTPIALMLYWGTIYIAAAEVSHDADSSESGATGVTVGTPLPLDPGNGDPGLAYAFLRAHAQFQLVCVALGLLCYLAAGAVWFTYELLTFEMYVVLAIGVIATGFAGLGATSAFAKGFPLFVVNLATRFFAYYFVCAATGIVLEHVDAVGVLGGLVGASAVPMGIGAMSVLFATSSLPVLAVFCAVIVYAIPQLASSMLRGSGALSAGAMWSQFNGAISQAKHLTPGKDGKGGA